MTEARIGRTRRADKLVEPVSSLLAALEDLDETGDHRKPFETRFKLLDTVLEGGFSVHDLILIGGRPGVGKTIAALQWARNMAADGRRAIFACYEHDEHELLARLLLMEIGELPRPEDAGELPRLRTAVRKFAAGRMHLEELIEQGLMLRAAYEKVRSYSENLSLVRASGSHTDLASLAEMAGGDNEPGVLFVDYLQKVATPGHEWEESAHNTYVVEGLKEIALQKSVAVVAITAAASEGLTARRLKPQHLRGAAALAYEADAIILLNEKIDAVSRVHLTYGPSQAAAFQQQVIFSIEKNRRGPAGIDLEFNKDFSYYRFVSSGHHVGEKLIDDHLYRE